MKHFHQKLALFLFLAILQLPAWSQTVRGRVTDSHDLPVAFASILIPGTAFGTSTDENGHFLLKAKAGQYNLRAQAIGFEATNLEVNLTNGKESVIAFHLKPVVTLMQEVAVAGVKVKTATATRTLLELEDIPQAISVIGQKDIRQQAAFDLTTIARNISGLNFTGSYSGTGSSQFFNARGFDLNDAQNYRWNGMMIWNWGNNYNDNIEQVEFLKGPTSILFGDVAPGGILNLVTKKPLADFRGELTYRTGSWGLARPALDITGPFSKDRKLRYRLNTSFEYQNSFRDFVSSRKAFIAPALAWDISPKLKVSAEATFNRSSATDDAGLVSPNGSVSGLKALLPNLYLGEPTRRYRYDNQNYMAAANYQFSDNWRLKVAGFYAHSTNSPFGLWFEQPDSLGNFGRNSYGFYQKANNSSVTAEVNGTFYTGTVKHHVLIGAEYQTTGQRYTNAGELSPLDSSNIYTPAYGNVLPQPTPSPLKPYVAVIARKGVFMQDQILLLKERLQVLVGVRIGSTRQGNEYADVNATDTIVEKTIVTPRIGIVYKVKENATIYASYAEGYEINSPDIFAQNFQQYMTPPATLSRQLEFGVKTNLLQNRLGLTLSVFEINKRNPYGYVYLNPDNPDYDMYNVYYDGHHRSRGVELEANGFITPQLSLTAAAAYTATKVIADPGYPTGNRLPNAPKYTANAWLNYSPASRLKGFSVGAGFFYKDKFFSSIANNPLLQIPAGYRVDGAVGYAFKRAGVQLNVRNLTNQVAYLNPWQFNLFEVQPLRQYVLTLTYKFVKM